MTTHLMLLFFSGLKPVVCKEEKCIFRFSELGLGVSVYYEMKYVNILLLAVKTN